MPLESYSSSLLSQYLVKFPTNRMKLLKISPKFNNFNLIFYDFLLLFPKFSINILNMICMKYINN